MGDVVTALGRAIKEEGHKVQVIIPKFDCLNYKQVQNLHQDGSFPFGGTVVRVWRGIVEELETIFLEPENGHFSVGCIYGKNNDHVRYAFTMLLDLIILAFNIIHKVITESLCAPTSMMCG